MRLCPGFAHDFEVDQLIEDDGRAVRRSDEHLIGTGLFSLDDPFAEALELASRIQCTVDGEDDVFGRKRFALMELDALADRKEEPFGDALIAGGKRRFELAVGRPAQKPLIDGGDRRDVEVLILSVNVEREDVAGSRPAEVRRGCAAGGESEGNRGKRCANLSADETRHLG